eukprot:TRINITY_DN3768_c0_g1_i2.p1 TRINITY_DN3768_c0_g1~~TRINITY_DN3768_c0_g1_i2.p1  ORF type:complete len:241 (+),score=39.67 TRINITY_DN3768_c0_g1_i2:1-723(+)
MKRNYMPSDILSTIYSHLDYLTLCLSKQVSSQIKHICEEVIQSDSLRLHRIKKRMKYPVLDAHYITTKLQKDITLFNNEIPSIPLTFERQLEQKHDNGYVYENHVLFLKIENIDIDRKLTLRSAFELVQYDIPRYVEEWIKNDDRKGEGWGLMGFVHGYDGNEIEDSGDICEGYRLCLLRDVLFCYYLNECEEFFENQWMTLMNENDRYYLMCYKEGRSIVIPEDVYYWNRGKIFVEFCH